VTERPIDVAAVEGVVHPAHDLHVLLRHRTAQYPGPLTTRRIAAGLIEQSSVEAGADSEQQLRERAVQRLKKKRDFHTHVLIYVAVNAFLVAIWAVTSGGYFWPIFPILGWGIAVVANAWDVYGRKPISEEEIRREADRLRG
jgi:2TM domain